MCLEEHLLDESTHRPISKGEAQKISDDSFMELKCLINKAIKDNELREEDTSYFNKQFERTFKDLPHFHAPPKAHKKKLASCPVISTISSKLEIASK